MGVIIPSNKMLVAHRDRFILEVYKRPRLTMNYGIHKVYEIAVGRAGHETPRGLFLINSKLKNPSWTVPVSNWTDPSTWGQVYGPGDPRNPLAARWLGIWEGVGIHGIPHSEDSSIGHPESHGCLRMHIKDVIELYPQVPLFTPIYII